MFFFDYERKSIFINTLGQNGIKVHEYKFNYINKKPTFKSIVLSLYNHLKQSIRDFKKLKNLDFDLILFFSEISKPIQFLLAKILSLVKGVPLINDIYISKFQTNLYDRELDQRNSKLKFFWFFFYYFLDLFECSFSDYIILDTFAHIKFFHEKFNIPINKFRRVLVGANEKIFKPINKKKDEKDIFKVGFWGTYIPLHGIKYILKAAKILENDSQIKFLLLGKGPTLKNNLALSHELNLRNVEFILKIIPLDELKDFISNCDIGLGIFGETPKTLQVIPNKVYQGIAMKLPMITCESTAIKEIFTNNKDIIMCQRADPKSIVKAILKLKENYLQREKIRKNAFILFENKCSTKPIGKTLIKTLNNFLIDWYILKNK